MLQIEDYYNTPCVHHKRMRDLVAKLELQGTERILDVGCGDGRLTAQIATRVPQGSVLGIDISQDIVDFALKKFPSSIYPNLNFECRDAKDLNSENEFDLIVSFGSLHCIDNHLDFLTNFQRSITRCGRLVLSFLGKNKTNSFPEIIKEFITQSQWSELCNKSNIDYGLYSSEEYQLLLKAAGIKLQKTEIFSEVILCQCQREIKDYVKTNWLSLTSRIPQYLYEQFLGELIDYYIERNPPNSEGFIEYKAIWLTIEGIRD